MEIFMVWTVAWNLLNFIVLCLVMARIGTVLEYLRPMWDKYQDEIDRLRAKLIKAENKVEYLESKLHVLKEAMRDG